VIGKERSMARIYLVGAAVETILNVALIPQFGLIGTATAATIASVCILLQFALLIQHDVRLWPNSRIGIGIAGASVGMGIIAYGLYTFTHLHILVIIPVCAICYGVLLLAFRVTSIRQIANLLSMVLPKSLRPNQSNRTNQA
jgi:O-antigen/teichoic acid export membrane protein